MITVRIDKKHSDKLIAGEPIAIKVPSSADTIKLQLTTFRESPDGLTKFLNDVFGVKLP